MLYGRVVMASRKLKLGDIVFCQRDNILFGDKYQHYGVYAGYKKIIHYIKGDSPFDSYRVILQRASHFSELSLMPNDEQHSLQLS